MCCKGEERSRNDGDVDGDCVETALKGFFKVCGEGIGEVGDEPPK